jgi:hypothetical protein
MAKSGSWGMEASRTCWTVVSFRSNLSSTYMKWKIYQMPCKSLAFISCNLKLNLWRRGKI